jgi:hypothetical protein
MATVKCYAEIDGRPFDIPRREDVYSPRLGEIEEIMLPLAKFYKERFSDEHEIWLTWDEDKFINGKPHVVPYSATVHVADLIFAYGEHALQRSPE